MLTPIAPLASRKGLDTVLGKIISTLLFVLGSTTPGLSEEVTVDLVKMSLEELMNIDITTVSKKEEKLFESPAAVYVITPEDLRGSGARNIPDALRTVPGMQVVKINANKWSATTRGFANLFANKLLVLIDGRSVYSPLFSGVFWDTQDLVLEDVEQVEVVRGPGGALWGANAVNGIINIITKKARDTQGGWAQMGGGTEERGFATVRYGGRLGEQAYYRVYGKYFTRDASVDSAGQPGEDDWRVLRTGGRIDWELSAQNSLILQGNVYDGEIGQPLSITTSLSPPYVQTIFADSHVSGGSVLGRWERTVSDRSGLALQLYYDRSARNEYVLQSVVHNTDIDFQHRFRPIQRQEIVWGLGYRFTTDDLDGSFSMSFDPPSRHVHLFSGFVQDDISLARERLRLTLGSKFEHNSYTGLEWQPNVRFWWSPVSRNAFWGAVSRAVRTPSRGENAVRASAWVLPPDSLFAGAPLTLVRFMGDRDVVSETVLAFDLGYRTRLRDGFSLDLAAFYNRYGSLFTNELDLQSFEILSPPSHLVVPIRIDNKAKGKTYGVELAADWQVRDTWRLRTAYTYFQMDLEVAEDSFDTVTETFAGENPIHQLSVRSYQDLSAILRLDVTGRYVDDLPRLDIGHYLTFDIHLGWHPSNGLELSLVGQNLLDSPHPEFTALPFGVLPSEVQAGIYSALAWRF